MTVLSKGANAPVDAAPVRVAVRWRDVPGVGEVDASAFVLGASGKVAGDAGMVFYGQPAPGDGSVRLERSAHPGPGTRETVFAVDIPRLGADVERVAFAGTLHEAAAKGLSFGKVPGVEITVSAGDRTLASFPVDTAGAPETALVLGELYRRQGAWKFRAVGQGYAGGLKPLAEGYGVDVSDAPPPPPPQPTVDLRKRTVDLAKRDPKVGGHALKALDAIEGAGLAGEKADVWLVLDISASMDELYGSRKVDDLLTRVLAAAFSLDDDGEINVVLFGKRAHYYGTVSLADYREFGTQRARRFPLEPDTMYGEAIDLVRSKLKARPKEQARPAYVMFVTDGGTRDVRRSKDSITEAAREPAFWQFMAIGRHEGGHAGPSRILKRLPRGFDFLEMLDTMEGRVVDNANFFAVEDPSLPTDEELYGMMFAEFPDWLRKARDLGIVGPRR